MQSIREYTYLSEIELDVGRVVAHRDHFIQGT
jgi:hypothetical protein